MNSMHFQHSAAAKSTSSSPCSNVPLRCPVCYAADESSPAVWRYNLLAHFEESHPREPKSKYESLWKLDKEEEGLLRSIYRRRHEVPKERQGKLKKAASKALPFPISESTGTQLAMRYVNISFINYILSFAPRVVDLTSSRPRFYLLFSTTDLVTQSQVLAPLPYDSNTQGEAFGSQSSAPAETSSLSGATHTSDDEEELDVQEVPTLNQALDESESDVDSWDSDKNDSLDGFESDAEVEAPTAEEGAVKFMSGHFSS